MLDVMCKAVTMVEPSQVGVKFTNKIVIGLPISLIDPNKFMNILNQNALSSNGKEDELFYFLTANNIGEPGPIRTLF